MKRTELSGSVRERLVRLPAPYEITTGFFLSLYRRKGFLLKRSQRCIPRPSWHWDRLMRLRAGSGAVCAIGSH